VHKILISNDDGIKGPGLKPLIKELSKIGKVHVIVPNSQMSGTGHSITLRRYKEIYKTDENLYVIKGGTPAECVKYGLQFFFKNKIDLVVSGINTCPNLGEDVIYSGTVAAAREGALKGIPSLAVSAAETDAREYRHSAVATREIAEIVLKRKNFFKNVCLNINIPRNYKGIKIVPLGTRAYVENVESIVNKKGNLSYKLSGTYISGYKNRKTDVYMVKKGFISVTPLKINQTDFELIKKIKLL
jgi:5'-nucleotidase